MNRPNVLFLLVDCLRSDAMFASNRQAITPTLDLLRDAGAAFTQTVASASSTTPCVASLLTSTYSFTHGVRSIFGLKVNPTVQSLIECFRQEGYFTFAEVTGPLFPETGLDKGFDDYRFREGTEYLSTSWGTDFRSRISKKATRPWFCFLHLWELHHNRHVLPSFNRRMYGRNRYERALSCLDAELRRLLEVVPEDTLIVVHGDHGEHVVETDLRYRWYRLVRDLSLRKNTKREGHEMDVSETLIRVPIILSTARCPEHPLKFLAGKRVPQLVRQIDLHPTILDLIGAPVPESIHGTSLKPALVSDTILELEAYIEAFLRVRSDPSNRRVGWRTAEWKYVFAPGNPNEPRELYNVALDPTERNNLIHERTDVAAELQNRIQSIENGPLARGSEYAMSAQEKVAIEKRLVDLGYM